MPRKCRLQFSIARSSSAAVHLPGCSCHEAKPSDCATIGCSYHYNAGELTYLLGGGTRHRQADAFYGVSDKPESWVSEPVRYLLMHEPPARIYPGS